MRWTICFSKSCAKHKRLVVVQRSLQHVRMPRFGSPTLITPCHLYSKRFMKSSAINRAQWQPIYPICAFIHVYSLYTINYTESEVPYMYTSNVDTHTAHTHTCTVIICKYTYVCILYHIMIYYVHMHMQLSAVNIAIILQLHMNAYLHCLDTQHHSHLDVGHSNSCRCQVAVERLVSVSHENSLPANLQTLANVPKTSPVQTHL